jgi:hypothetical protein
MFSNWIIGRRGVAPAGAGGALRNPNDSLLQYRVMGSGAGHRVLQCESPRGPTRSLAPPSAPFARRPAAGHAPPLRGDGPMLRVRHPPSPGAATSDNYRRCPGCGGDGRWAGRPTSPQVMAGGHAVSAEAWETSGAAGHVPADRRATAPRSVSTSARDRALAHDPRPDRHGRLTVSAAGSFVDMAV